MTDQKVAKTKSNKIPTPASAALKDQSLPQYLTVAQVASMFNVSGAFVRRLLRDGLLSGVKLGTARNSPVRITSRSLENLLEACAITGNIPLKKATRKPKNKRPYQGVFNK